MVGFCLFGAGEIGTVHAANIAGHPDATLCTVVDVVPAAGRALAERHGAAFTDDAEAAITDSAHEAILIASDAWTHAELVTRSARAGKAIFCEKPLDVDLGKAEASAREVEAAGVPFQIGFHRRYDPSFAELRAAVESGELGEVALVVLAARDTSVPTVAYVSNLPGYIWKDFLIHDLDAARWLLGEEPVEVFAAGSCVIEPSLKEMGEVDTVAVTLRTARGALCQISAAIGSRHGFDQRAEIFGTKGMAAVDNKRPTTFERFTAEGTRRDNPSAFFLDRYADSYRAELDRFVSALHGGTTPSPGLKDGLQALRLAEAGIESVRTGAPVAVSA